MKYKKKIIKKKRTINRKCLFISMIFSFCILVIGISSLLGISNANYTNYVDIDSEKNESAYELIIEENDYSVWYANSEKRHFLFIDFVYQINETTKSIYTDDFSYDISDVDVETSFLISTCKNNTLELEIERVLVENEFKIDVGSVILGISVEPKSSTIVYSPEEEEGEKTKVIHATPFEDLYNSYKERPILAIMHTTIVLFLFFSILFGLIYGRFVVKERPIAFFPNCVSKKDWLEILPKDYTEKLQREDEEFNIESETIKVGRFLEEGGLSKITQKNMLFFKNGKNFILEIHCDEHFGEVNNSRKRRVNIIQTDFFDYELMVFNIPDEDQPYKKIIKKGAMNNLRVWFARRLPIKSLALRVKDHIKTEPTGEKLKKVLYLIHRDGKERLTQLADFRFKIKVPDDKDPDKSKWILKKAQPLFYKQILEEDITVIKESIRVYNKRELIKEIEPALRKLYKDSELNIRSNMLYMKTMLLKEIKEKEKEIFQLRIKDARRDANLNIEYAKKIAKFKHESNVNLPLFMETYISEFQLTNDHERSMKVAYESVMKNRIIQQYKDKKEELENPDLFLDLKKENQELNKKLEIYEKGNGKPKPGSFEEQFDKQLDKLGIDYDQ